MTRATPPKKSGKPPKKRALTRSAWICDDNEVADAFEEKKNKRERLDIQFRSRPTPEIHAELEKAIAEQDAAFDELKAASVKYVFRSIGHKKYDHLVNEHPMDDEARELVKKQGGDPDAMPWNPNTFPKALIARSIVEPAWGTEEERLEFFDSDDWNSGEINSLFQAAMEANTSRRIVPLGRDS